MKTKIEIILVLDRIPTFSYYIIQSTISWFPHGDSWTVGLSFCKVVGRVINLIDEPSSYFWAYPYKLQKCHTYSTHTNSSSSCCCCNFTFEISFQKQSVLHHSGAWWPCNSLSKNYFSHFHIFLCESNIVTQRAAIRMLWMKNALGILPIKKGIVSLGMIQRADCGQQNLIE